MVDSVLDVIKVIVSHGYTILGNLVLSLLHWIGTSILYQLISALNLLSEGALSLLSIDL